MSHRQRGFALLIVLWSVVLFSLILTQVTASGRSEVLLAGNLRRAAVLQAETDGAVHEAIFHLLDPASRWAADGSVHTLQRPGATIGLRVTDQGGLVNPNHVPPPVLAAFLRAAGAGDAEQLANAIVQWRAPSAQPPGASDAARLYRAAGRDYAPPQNDFRSIAELGLVLGMTPDLLARIAPHMTVYTGTELDPRLADPLVQQALASIGIPVPPGQAGPPLVVTVAAVADGPEGARFARSAVVSLGIDRKGSFYRVITWDSPSL